MKCALLLMMTFYLSSAEDTGALEVFYPQRTITAAAGSSVLLSCQAQYDSHTCGRVNVVWSHLDPNPKRLTDPGRFFTRVKEAIFNGNMRRRQVTTEILHLTPEDEGRFQCMAECENGESAMGHFIVINVQV